MSYQVNSFIFGNSTVNYIETDYFRPIQIVSDKSVRPKVRKIADFRSFLFLASFDKEAFL